MLVGDDHFVCRPVRALGVSALERKCVNLVTTSKEFNVPIVLRLVGIGRLHERVESGGGCGADCRVDRVPEVEVCLYVALVVNFFDDHVVGQRDYDVRICLSAATTRLVFYVVTSV